MKIPPSELIDKITIIRLKIEYSADEALKMNLQKEFNELRKSIENFEKRGVKIESEWLDKIYEMNKEQWNLESAMKKALEEKNLVEMGRLYIEIQKACKRRVGLKNKISEECGVGFKDISIN